jgi:flagellar motility protein MotE (MotC chaperone)
MRYFRLLPAVIVLGLTLLVLKGTGIVREAEAQNAPQQIADASTNDAVAQPKDAAGDDGETSSAAEVDVLSSLSKRRTELDTRARAQDMRENVLAATEKRVDEKIAALKALQTQITALLGQRDAAQEKQVASLVKTYSSMKPKDAARIFDGLSDDVLIPVAQEMKSDALAPVLAAMNPSAAQKLTVKLASKLSLPDTAAAAVPLPALAPLQTQAAATPAPTTATPQAVAPQTPAPQPVAQQAVPPAPQAAAPQTAPTTGKHG